MTTLIGMINDVPIHITKMAMVPEKDANDQTIGWKPGYIQVEGKIYIHPDAVSKFIAFTKD